MQPEILKGKDKKQGSEPTKRQTVHLRIYVVYARNWVFENQPMFLVWTHHKEASETSHRCQKKGKGRILLPPRQLSVWQPHCHQGLRKVPQSPALWRGLIQNIIAHNDISLFIHTPHHRGGWPWSPVFRVRHKWILSTHAHFVCCVLTTCGLILIWKEYCAILTR